MGIPITWDCKIPANMIEKIKELGREWNKSRPKFDPEIERDWDDVIDKWATESDMPLIIYIYIMLSTHSPHVLITDT